MKSIVDTQAQSCSEQLRSLPMPVKLNMVCSCCWIYFPDLTPGENYRAITPQEIAETTV